jgi:hypothetical protein
MNSTTVNRIFARRLIFSPNVADDLLPLVFGTNALPVCDVPKVPKHGDPSACRIILRSEI